MGIPILGGGEKLAELYKQGIRLAVNAVGGIGDIQVRVKIFERLAQHGFACPSLVHPSAYVEPSASLAAGVQIFPHAYIGSEASIGFGAIINTGTIVSHECHIGDYVNLSPGAILAGQVEIGDKVLIGMGVTINLGVKIGSGARIGNNATIKGDVPPNSIIKAGMIYPS
jgi:sugar O-acyltransferase (sialic acid O-acetyltransferase NeuD family)